MLKEEIDKYSDEMFKSINDIRDNCTKNMESEKEKSLISSHIPITLSRHRDEQLHSYLIFVQAEIL